MLVVRCSLVRASSPLAALASAAALLAAVVVLPSHAVAQSFFEQLFGAAPKPAYRPAAPLTIAAPRPYSPVHRPGQDDGEQRGSNERRGGSYRTVCVRLCDGAFFPISFSAQRSHMHGDADICRNRCWGTDARLFYHHNSADMKEAVDLGGRSYKALPTAFLFRKKLVDGCACKPAPWSTAELDRHRRYALAEGRVPPAQAPAAIGATVIAGSYPETRSEPVLAESIEQPAAAAEIDGIPVVNVPAAAPLIPRMAQADLGVPGRAAERAERPERGELRYEAQPVPKPRRERRQAPVAGAMQAPQQQQAPVWKVVKPTPQIAAGGPRRAAPAPATATLFGSPGGKYVWPGDGPTRYR